MTDCLTKPQNMSNFEMLKRQNRPYRPVLYLSAEGDDAAAEGEEGEEGDRGTCEEKSGFAPLPAPLPLLPLSFSSSSSSVSSLLLPPPPPPPLRMGRH